MIKVLGKDGKFLSIFKERLFGVVNRTFILPYLETQVKFF